VAFCFYQHAAVPDQFYHEEGTMPDLLFLAKLNYQFFLHRVLLYDLHSVYNNSFIMSGNDWWVKLLNG